MIKLPNFLSCNVMETPFNSFTNNKPRGASPQGQFYLILGEMGRFGKKGVMLYGLRISKKKEILCKLTVFDDGSNSNCRSLLSRCLASIQGPSLLIIEL